MNMASNMAAGIACSFVFMVLVSPGCLAGKNQQLSYESWDRMLEGEWMVKL